MGKTIERSLSQVLYKYLPQAYADFDIEGTPITSRVVGWNDKIQSNQNKKRIMYELYSQLNKFSSGNEQIALNTLLIELDKNKTEAFDIRSLSGKKDENDHEPEIISVLRPYVFYCAKCGLVHIITDYKNVSLKNYRFYISETYSYKKHKCLDCGGRLKQQQIIRISANGNAYDYEPICEIHKDKSKYYLKKGESRDYFCSECNRVVKRPFNLGEDLTPALDPKVFFPQIMTIVDLKSDDKVEMISKIQYLPKLLVLSEFGIISNEKYLEYRNTLIELYVSGVDHKSPKYIMKTRDAKKEANSLNEPKFETFNNEKSYYYENLALRLLEFKEIKTKTTVLFDEILESNIKNNTFVSNKELDHLLNQCLIEKISISESVPVNNIAYGYTRLFSEVTEENNVQLKLYKDYNTDKYNLYSHKLESEGVLIQFNRELIIEWIKGNLKEVMNDQLIDLYVSTHDDYRIDYFNNGIRSVEMHTIYKEVLHTASHVFMKSISVASGIEVTALSEMIFPEVGAIFIYCTSVEGMVLNSIKTAITKRLYYIIKQALDSVKKCNLKNLCDAKEKQACLGCVIIPEIACKEFNAYLDRKLLSNNKSRQYHVRDNSLIHIEKGMWI